MSVHKGSRPATPDEILESETILEDNYPVYYDYVYLADGKIVRSDIQGTVRDLKRDVNAKEIRRCDVTSRMKKIMNEKKSTT